MNNQSDGTPSTGKKRDFAYCSLPDVPERTFGPEVNRDRLRLIRYLEKKWVNGTILHYYFFDKPTDGETITRPNGQTELLPWTTNEEEKNVVRQAFDIWKNVGIGLEFNEVASREDAEVRIGFQQGDGAWSYVGRDILDQGNDARTMNFGWDLTSHPQEIDTAVHEIGHTLGFPHEHQNPYAGIIWDEEAVYRDLAMPPNSWSRDKTYYNIIRKINPDSVQGSNWDHDSIMHYPFSPGMIKEPEEYKNGLFPEAGLSNRDKTWVKTFYPLIPEDDYTDLLPFESNMLEISPGEQRNFIIKPNSTRYYDIRTFGTSDTVMVLFEEEGGELKYRTADDDSGEDYNAYLHVKLHKKHKYILRIRLYYSHASGETSVMLW